MYSPVYLRYVARYAISLLAQRDELIIYDDMSSVTNMILINLGRLH